LEHGIIPIVCLDTPYLEEQIKAIYQLNLPIDRCLIAYEPLAAIGSGQPANLNLVESAATQIAFLTDSGCPILYGGSVTEENIASFVGLPNISGVLVGSASLNPHQFTSLMSQIS